MLGPSRESGDRHAWRSPDPHACRARLSEDALSRARLRRAWLGLPGPLSLGFLSLPQAQQLLAGGSAGVLAHLRLLCTGLWLGWGGGVPVRVCTASEGGQSCPHRGHVHTQWSHPGSPPSKFHCCLLVREGFPGGASGKEPAGAGT